MLLFSGTNTITGGTSGAGTTTGNTETVTLLNSNSLSLTSGYDKSRVTRMILVILFT